MSRVFGVLLVVLIVAVVLALLAAVGGLFVWAASGIGWALINWLRLPFSPFEATLLSLIAFGAVVVLAWRLLSTVITLPLSSPSGQDLDEDEDDWDEEDEEDEDEEEFHQAAPVSSIPKWRQPARRIPVVGPDERCPCGSGRKYKNCHGRKS